MLLLLVLELLPVLLVVLVLPLVAELMVEPTSSELVARTVVVTGGRRKCAEVDLGVGPDRVEDQGIHTRSQVDPAAGDRARNCLRKNDPDHVAADCRSSCSRPPRR